MTVSPSHPVTEQVFEKIIYPLFKVEQPYQENIIDMTNDEDYQFNIYFVVPSSIYGTFATQILKSATQYKLNFFAQNIVQWALEFPPAK